MLRFSLFGLLIAILLAAAPVPSSAQDADEDDAENTYPHYTLDLAATDGGELLVAEQHVGILAHDGSKKVSLPGASSIGWVDDDAMWVTTSGTYQFNNTGQALHFVENGEARLVFDLFKVEENLNADGNEPLDSNPFDVVPLGDGEALVIDAGANALYRVDLEGEVEVLATFPSGAPVEPSGVAPQGVPTRLAIGPDGWYYVGELTGRPVAEGISSIWKVSPDARGERCGTSDACVKVFDGGFTSIMDLAFGPDGLLYVAEFDEHTWEAMFSDEIELVGGTISACDVIAEHPSCTVRAADVPTLTSIAFDTDGRLWAVQNGVDESGADVVEIH